MVGRGRDRRHGEGARVGREDRARREGGIERPEDRPLGLEVLEGRLDDKIGSRGRDVVEGGGVAQPFDPALDPRVGGIGVEIETGGAPFEAGPDARPAALDRGRVDVVQDHVVARLERELGDPGAHRPGTDDRDDAHGADRDAAATVRPA